MQHKSARKKVAKSTVLWTLIALAFLLIASALGSTTGTFVALGIIGLVTVAYAFFTKKPSWLNLRSKKSISVVFILSILCFFVPGPGEDRPEASGGDTSSSAGTNTEAGTSNEADTSAEDGTNTEESNVTEESVDSEPAEPEETEPESAEPESKDPESKDPESKDPESKDPDGDTPAVGTALEALDALEVKGRAPKTGYDRKAQFGNPWTDVEYNGCDTRNDILKRDLIDIVVDNKCRVLTGTLIDKFSGEEISFERGQYTSAEVQIDHVVALSDAWQKGAQNMTREQRVVFANDPINLLAVSGSLNGQKSDSDAASWLPPYKPFRCEFVAIQVSVKFAYDLWVTKGEEAAMRDVLEGCDDQPIIESTYGDLMQANSQ